MITITCKIDHTAKGIELRIQQGKKITEYEESVCATIHIAMKLAINSMTAGDVDALHFRSLLIRQINKDHEKLN